MTQDSPRRLLCTRRKFIAWTGLGSLLGASAIAACRGDTPPPLAPPTAVPAAAAPAPVRPTSAPPTPDPLASLNYLHTEGASIVDAAGRPILLAGLNWFGLETENLAPHGLWARSYADMLDQIVQLGYNCLRLPFSNELFDPQLQPNGIDFYKNPDLKGLNGLQIMDKIVVGAGQRGLKIILDQHRPTTDSQSALWYTVELSQQDWIDQWRTLAQRYRGNDAVIGADLHNEPSGDCTWGSGDPKTDWPTAAESCAAAILAVNPHWLIVVEGIEKIQDQFGNVYDWTWQGGELINARVRPAKPRVPNQLVYSAHDYGPSVYDQGWFSDPTFPKNLPAFWDFHWGYLQKDGNAPVLVGEFGGPSVGNDKDGQWQRALVDYLRTNRMHYTYWAFNANSADTGGLLEPDWSTVNSGKQALLHTYQGTLLGNQTPTLINTDAVPQVSRTRLPIKALQYDATMKDWTNLLKPELYVMNKTMAPMDLSKLELRYWFAPNGANDPRQHTVQFAGTSTQNFGKVLTGGQVQAEVVAERGVSFGGNPLFAVRITFAPGVTAPARDCVGFGLKVQRIDGGQYFQPSHYSYRDYHWPSEWNHVGLFRAGDLVWGITPQTYAATEEQKQRAIDAQRDKYLGG